MHVDLSGVHIYFSLIPGYNIFYFSLFLAITYASILVFSLSSTAGLFHTRFVPLYRLPCLKLGIIFKKIKTLILQYLHSEAA